MAAYLLHFWQEMKLKREENQLSLDLTRITSSVSRIEKNITRQQKYFQSLFANLDADRKRLESQATVEFQNMMGLGSNSFDPYNMNSLNSLNAGMLEFIQNGCMNVGITLPDNTVHKVNQNAYNNLYLNWQQNGAITPARDKDNKVDWANSGFGENDAKCFNLYMSQARQAQAVQQQRVRTLSANYTNNLSIWFEAEKARLEARQDEVIEPLTYKQTMLELDKTQIENRLKRIQAEKDAHKGAKDQAIQDMAPTFGV